MNEIWRPVGRFENYYEVSNWGRIRSVRKGCIMATRIDNKGYKSVTFCVDTVLTVHRVHRLVALAFLEPSDKLQVNHLDGNKLNNRLDNLEWTDNRGNQLHAIALGLTNPPRGEENANNRWEEHQVYAVLQAYADGKRQYEIAAEMGIPFSTVSSIVKRRTWRHLKWPLSE